MNGCMPRRNLRSHIVGTIVNVTGEERLHINLLNIAVVNQSSFRNTAKQTDGTPNAANIYGVSGSGH
jgi:hypothetical protein